MSDVGRSGPGTSALFTDLYQLTMARAYREEGMDRPAVFELLVRGMPGNRNFLVAAGLAELLDDLEALRVTDGDIDYLRTLDLFDEAFLAAFRGSRFEGDIDAVPEGTPVFAGTPLVRVHAPIMQAQVIETLVLNRLHFATLAASKALRLVLAARGRSVVDFGTRRAPGTDAALRVARTGYLVGLDGTALVEAGQRYGIPVVGTMAHSFIQSHDAEADAFLRFARAFPGTTLLVDTYDTIEAIETIVRLRREHGDGFQIGAIRLDSGDLADLARHARSRLDAAGMTDVRIIASGGLDEYKIAKLVAADAPIDGFGVGTSLAVSDDLPSLDMAYKLVAYDGRPRTKLSSSKVIRPGAKQVDRSFDDSGRMSGDRLRLDSEPGLPGSTALLRPVIRAGHRVDAGFVTLEQARAEASRQFDGLPEPLRSLDPVSDSDAYPVAVSDALRELTEHTLRAAAHDPRTREDPSDNG